jgi:hypothetical protein
VPQGSHYDVLGVPATATPDEVRAAFRQAARDHHPDTGGDGRRMLDLNAAWHVLGDPIRRAAYDRQLARRGQAGHGGVAAGAAAWSAGPGDAPDAPVSDEWRDLEVDLADDRPYGPTRALDGWWAILPPATLVAGIALLCGAFVFTAPGLLAVAGGVFVLALGLFVLAPLRAMSRKP